MKYTPTPLKGSYLIDLEKQSDPRGFFARLFCSEEFAKNELESKFVQVNNSHSVSTGTLRGLHYQLEPMSEVKVVRCVQGSLFDVILDLRPSSSTFGKSFGTVLSASNRQMMYVPKGFAHGFVTLEENTELIYFVSQVYSRELERGIRWNDPRFAIPWPITPTIISERDRLHPDFDENYHLIN